MVAHLLRLKFSLLRNSLRRSTWQLVGVIIGGLYGLGTVIAVWAVMASLSFVDPQVGRVVAILGGSAVMVGWIVIPLLASGIDMTLDPARFVTFAIPLRQLLLGIALGGFLGVPGAATLLAALSTVALWARHPLAALAAFICAILAVLTCIVVAQAVTSANTNLAASRRFKDFSSVVLFIPLLLLGPLIAGITNGIKNLHDALPQWAEFLGWTPLGAPWSVPADLALGHPGEAAAKLGIVVAVLAIVTWLWSRSLAHAMETPSHSSRARKGAGKLGFFRWFPATPMGAVAGRALSYWIRDPRYSMSLILAVVLPMVMSISAVSRGDYSYLGYIGSLAVLLLVWSISADISYDNTAFALHISTGVSGFADRAGRALACATLALPLGLLYAVVGAIVGNSVANLPAMLGLVLGGLGTGLGLASIFSARVTMKVPLPGQSPFRSQAGGNFGASLLNLGGMTLVALLCTPEVILAVVAAATHQVSLGWISLATGIVLGGVLLTVGLRLGGKIYDQRAPELLQSVSQER